jgi:hypothetical protein
MMATSSGQSDIRCMVDLDTIDQCALTYASDVCSKVRLLALMAPSLRNKAALAHLLATAAQDLIILERMLKSS